jgi:DNA damage-binding protein 1
MDNSLSNNSEISAVSCVPQDTSRCFSTLIAVSFWESNCVQIFSIERREPRLRHLCKSFGLPSVPRSLLLHDFVCHDQGSGLGRCTHLLAGLGNGTVIFFAFKDGKLQDQKSVYLGGAPVCMMAYRVDGKPAVLVSGHRASIFFWDKNRLQQSPLVFKVGRCGSAFFHFG